MWKTTLKLVAAALVCGGCCCNSDCGAAEIIEEDVVVVAPEAKGALNCAAPVKKGQTTAHVAKEHTKPAAAAARKVGQKLVDSICKNDSKGFCSTLCPNMKKHFTPKHFARGCKQLHDRMGKPVKGEFLAELAHPVFNISVWKVTFLKEIPGKKPEERQALFQVVTGEKDGKMQLLGFGFI